MRDDEIDKINKETKDLTARILKEMSEGEVTIEDDADLEDIVDISSHRIDVIIFYIPLIENSANEKDDGTKKDKETYSLKKN